MWVWIKDAAFLFFILYIVDKVKYVHVKKEGNVKGGKRGEVKEVVVEDGGYVRFMYEIKIKNLWISGSRLSSGPFDSRVVCLFEIV